MFSLENEKLWIKVSLLIILALVFIIDLYVIFKYGNYFLLGSMEKMDNDDVRYIRTAQILLEKGILVDNDINKPTVAEMPGHALMLAVFFKVFGYSAGLTAFRIFQAILQVLSLMLVFLIARKLFCSTVGIIACIVNALYVPEISIVGLILMEVMYKFLILLLIYISIHAVMLKETRYYAAGGIVWALACLLRPTVAMFPGVILLLWIIYRYPFREMARLSLITTMIFCVIMTPWWIRNYLAFDRFIPLALASGNPFLQGTYLNYDQTREVTSYMPYKDAVELDKIEMEIGIKRLKAYFSKYPLQYIHWYTLGKTKYLWHQPYYWKKVFNISFDRALAVHFIIIITGITGTVICLTRKRTMSAFLILPILYVNVIHLPYFTFSRYAYPVMPLVIILGSYGLRELYLFVNPAFHIKQNTAH